MSSDGKKGTTEADDLGSLSELFEPYVWHWFTQSYGAPSPPQIASWPRIAEGRNTLIFSPTGSGKTLAAFLWCLNELFRMGQQADLEDSVYVLYISPLKALNNDIHKNLHEPLRGIRHAAEAAGIELPEVRSRVRTGDTTASERAAMARRPPHILITTPESLFIILATIKFREALRNVRYVIVDEIHAVSDNKRGTHLALSLERLQHLVGHEFVRIGLSATQRPLSEIARFLVGVADDGVPRPCEIVDIGARKNLNVQVISPVDNLLEASFDAIWGSAYGRMISMIQSHETTLIFANSRYKAERTALRLGELAGEGALAVGAHHGSMSKRVRLEMENKLKAGELDALVATSSLELGIDVGSIDLVCQIQSPKSVSSGMQRIGRAGHLLDATSEGRLLVTDRDDLVESAVLVHAIMRGEIDRTRIPLNCLDVLAQHIVGAVAADAWRVDDLYALLRQAYPFRELSRDDYEGVLDMLAGNYGFDLAQAPYPKLMWDKVNNLLHPERSARLIAFGASGTIPDTALYDVYFQERKTRVGQLDEGFVEELHPGDIFILGSSSWRVLGIRRNRVLVEDVYGQPPTIPFWTGERASRTYDLGVMVGQFRREMSERLSVGDPSDWLRDEYHVDRRGADALTAYFAEQALVTPELPTDRLVLVESFRDELGQRQVVIHASFGIRVNDAWAMALAQAVEDRYGYRPQQATTDDGILITFPAQADGEPSHRKDAASAQPLEPDAILDLVTRDNLGDLLERALRASPVFSARFRHNAVRSLLVLREYRGRRTPVWLQNLRSSSLLEACHDQKDFPVVAETLRECLHEAVDADGALQVLEDLACGRIEARSIETKVPSPFSHSLLLLGQYGEPGAIPVRERRSRLMHLHRELLRQILDEETLRHLLDEGAVSDVESGLQRTHPQRQARDADELARALAELGDLLDHPGEEGDIGLRVKGGHEPLLAELVASRRAVVVPITTAETDRQRWIATENLPLYRAAFALSAPLDERDEHLLEFLHEHGPSRPGDLPYGREAARRLERLSLAYRVLCLPHADAPLYVATEGWVPKHILAHNPSREQARKSLVDKHLHTHGPSTKYEIMDRYGFDEGWVEAALDELLGAGGIVRGEYVPTKSIPQWCSRSVLERIHRLTLERLRKEMEPATPEEYADFLIRWQHLHPDTRSAGVEGLLMVLEQLQGQENFQVLYERDILPSRIDGYAPTMLDALCQTGQLLWRRFAYKQLKRGQIGFVFRRDQDWVVHGPAEIDTDLTRWDDDLPEVCAAVRDYLRTHGACFFDDMVRDLEIDWRLVLRAVWHLVWTGEATNDSYASVRDAAFTTGLSGSYDLGTKPTRRGVTPDFIVHHMLGLRHLDPRLGRWAPTERLLPALLRPPPNEERAANWARLLLSRHGVMAREWLQDEVSAPAWRDLRRALVRLELLGQVRRGFFVEGLSGEQYATPEAVEALREAKLRGAETTSGAWAQASPAQASHEPMILLNGCDPANPYSGSYPLMDETGETVQFARASGSYMIVQGGRALLTYHASRVITLLVDLTRERLAQALRTVTQLVDQPGRLHPQSKVNILDWNGHPIDVSPARHLLVTLGFVRGQSRFTGWVYDGVSQPSDEEIALASKQIAEVYERAGKERAPAVYDAAWAISRAPGGIRDKVREVIPWLQRILPEECSLVYLPRGMMVRYRGIRCIGFWSGQKHLHMHITHRGWVPPIRIVPESDLSDPELMAEVLAQFERSRDKIDEMLDRQTDRYRPDAEAISDER